MTKKTAKRNDRLRNMIPCVPKPDMLVITRGIAARDDVAEILEKVKNFNDFNPDNDPYQEHDFGSFKHKGIKIFWKIDNYNGHQGYNLVLTVMLASEY